MSKRGATADTWDGHIPMTPDRKAIPYREEFTAAEMAQIRQGYIPEVMEEKWFVYMEGDWLYFHRSWTGLCVYMVRFERRDGRYAAIEAWADQDGTKRDFVSLEHDALQLQSLIHLLLLDEYIGFPRRPGDSDEEAAIRMWSLIGREMMRGEEE